MKHSRNKVVDTKIKKTSTWLDLPYKVIASNKSFQGTKCKENLVKIKMTSIGIDIL